MHMSFVATYPMDTAVFRVKWVLKKTFEESSGAVHSRITINVERRLLVPRHGPARNSDIPRKIGLPISAISHHSHVTGTRPR